MKVVALNADPDLDLVYEHEALRPFGVEIVRASQPVGIVNAAALPGWRGGVMELSN